MLEQQLDKEPNNDDDSHSASPFLNDMSTLTTGGKYLKCIIIAIIGTEFCERLCYYGIQGSLNLFLQKEMDQTKANASFNVAMFGGVCYLTPLLGGYIADSYLGRYKSILVFITFYLFGIVGLATISWILYYNNNNQPAEYEKAFFWIALYLIALGTGGIKPNVSTLGAEQFESDEPQFSLKHNSNIEIHNELMPVSNSLKIQDINMDNYALQRSQSDDNDNYNDKYNPQSMLIDESLSHKLLRKQQQQKETFFNWFYFSINCGSFFSFTIIAYLCQNINFGIGYTVPSIALIIGIIIFVLTSKYYRIVAPKGSILLLFIKIIFYAIYKGFALDNAKIKYGNDQVESVKSVVKVIPFLLFNIIYWCIYSQQSTAFYAQGCQMNITLYQNIEVPIAAINLFDIIPILLLVPFFDRILIPFLRKKGFKVTMLQRMGAGFIFAMMSVICAGILEMIRKNSDLTSSQSACDNSSGDDIIYVSNVSIFWQIPQFVFIGTSEVLTSITGLEFFFSQSPPQMRSILASLNLVTTGLGSWLVGVFILLVNINKNNQWITDNLDNGHLDYYFFMLAGLCLFAFCLFVRSASKYKYNSFEQELLVTDQNKLNDDDMFDDLMQTSPMSRTNVIQKTFHSDMTDMNDGLSNDK